MQLHWVLFGAILLSVSGVVGYVAFAFDWSHLESSPYVDSLPPERLTPAWAYVTPTGIYELPILELTCDDLIDEVLDLSKEGYTEGDPDDILVLAVHMPFEVERTSTEIRCEAPVVAEGEPHTDAKAFFALTQDHHGNREFTLTTEWHPIDEEEDERSNEWK